MSLNGAARNIRFCMEIVVQLIAELVGSFVSVAVGVALGSVALVAMLGIRRAHARVSRSSDVESPDGQLWSVRVVYGLGRKVSSRLAGMSSDARRERRSAGRSDTEVGRDEIWHPTRLLDAFDEAAGLVAPFVVIAAVAIGVLFAIELVVAIPIGILFLLMSAIRGRWQVEVVDPAGRRSVIDCPSLVEARDEASRTAALITGGIRP